MKKNFLILIITIILSPMVGFSQSQASFFSNTDVFLKQVVNANGKVDYALIASNAAQLHALVKTIESYDLADASDGEVKAFWINAYNLLVIHQVVDNWPINSPMDVNGFFNSVKYTAAGQTKTLNQLEKDNLLNEYGDPRFHFALVCGAVGCPVITNEAYTAEKLEMQLERQTKIGVNNNLHANLQGDNLYLSQIFNWYANDFGENDEAVVAWINGYRSTAIDTDVDLNYVDYDWTLNQQPQMSPAGGGSATAIPMDGPNTSATLSPNQNVQAITPSTLLRAGQYELKIFNNLYTQTAYFDENKDRIEGNRASYFTSIITFSSGFTPRVNFGLDLYFKSVRNDSPESSPFAVLQLGNGDQTRTALASIAPKIKFVPFPSVKGLAFQAMFILPVASDLEGEVKAADTGNGQVFLDYNDWQAGLQAFYDYSINRKWLAYFEAGAFFRFDTTPRDPNHELVVPIKALLNYYPTNSFTLYASSEFTPNTNEGWYSQFGLGGKYSISPKFEVETLFSLFPFGKNKGAGQTYNIGFRIIP